MCRSIKQLRSPAQPPSDEEVQAAALQFVRKVSGYRVPSQKNRAAFDQAVAEIAASTRTLLDTLAAESMSEKGGLERRGPSRNSLPAGVGPHTPPLQTASETNGQSRKESAT